MGSALGTREAVDVGENWEGGEGVWLDRHGATALAGEEGGAGPPGRRPPGLRGSTDLVIRAKGNFFCRKIVCLNYI